MAKKKYDGPTWEELAECGHSPKMIEAILAENGFYDDEENEENDDR